jgi:hypothetical protein
VNPIVIELNSINKFARMIAAANYLNWLIYNVQIELALHVLQNELELLLSHAHMIVFVRAHDLSQASDTPVDRNSTSFSFNYHSFGLTTKA